MPFNRGNPPILDRVLLQCDREDRTTGVQLIAHSNCAGGPCVAVMKDRTSYIPIADDRAELLEVARFIRKVLAEWSNPNARKKAPKRRSK